MRGVRSAATPGPASTGPDGPAGGAATSEPFSEPAAAPAPASEPAAAAAAAAAAAFFPDSISGRLAADGRKSRSVCGSVGRWPPRFTSLHFSQSARGQPPPRTHAPSALPSRQDKKAGDAHGPALPRCHRTASSRLERHRGKERDAFLERLFGRRSCPRHGPGSRVSGQDCTSEGDHLFHPGTCTHKFIHSFIHSPIHSSIQPIFINAHWVTKV